MALAATTDPGIVAACSRTPAWGAPKAVGTKEVRGAVVQVGGTPAVAAAGAGKRGARMGRMKERALSMTTSSAGACTVTGLG
jgi:hypothetical protein